MGYTPWGHTESDVTEHALTHSIIALREMGLSMAALMLRPFCVPGSVQVLL